MVHVLKAKYYTKTIKW